MKKVIVINPRGIKGDEEYLDGMVRALYARNDIDVQLYTNYYYEIDNSDIPYKYNRWFFKKSEKMQPSKKRNLVRIAEYIRAYMSLISIIKREQPDVVHIHWSVVSRLDFYFWKEIKKHCAKLVYTAHNVLPHVNSSKYIKSYGKLYECVDKIIVHGNSIFEEFSKIYPQYVEKVFVSRHGKKKILENEIDYSDIEVLKYKEYIKKYEKVFLCFGMIYYEKGMDRAISFWKQQVNHNNTCLIVAGKTQPSYPELDDLRDYAQKEKDILFIDQFLSNNLLAFFLEKADLIILPYRHASMSGVMLTAAAAGVPVLCTNVGALAEYMTDECGWIVANNDVALFEALENILSNYDKKALSVVGHKFREYIDSRYSWENIVADVVSHCY